MAVAVGEQRRRREAMDLLVAEISKGEEENITSSIRVAIERGWLNNFMDSLQDAKKRKEAEIDRICSRHYGDFLTSVSEMLKLRGAAGQLTDLVTDVHSKFSTTGGDLVRVLNELHEIQTERENARKLLEATLQCKALSSLMMKTRSLIESDDHYNAMRTIETIRIEMKLLSVSSMVTRLESWLPVAINKLLYGARSEADLFLEDLRGHLEQIGNTLMVRRARLNINALEGSGAAAAAAVAAAGAGADGENSSPDLSPVSAFRGGGGMAPGGGSPGPRRRFSWQQSRSTSSNNFNTGSSAGGGGGGGMHSFKICTALKHVVTNAAVFDLTEWARPADFDDLVPGHFTALLSAADEELVDTMLCDLAPLHKVLHLYAILGNLNSYHEHYRSIREDIFNRILKSADRIANQAGLLAALPKFFDQLVGFFCLESVIRRCVEIPEGVFSFSELAGLWDRACLQIGKLCSGLAITLTNPDALIRIKEDTLVLIDVVSDDALGLNPSGLYQVMRGLWEPFQGLQISEVGRACCTALESCAYQPYTATSFEALQSQVRAFQLETIELTHEDFFGHSSAGILAPVAAAAAGSAAGGSSGTPLAEAGSGAGSGGGPGSGVRGVNPISPASTVKAERAQWHRERGKLISMGKAAATLDALEEEIVRTIAGGQSASLSQSSDAAAPTAEGESRSTAEVRGKGGGGGSGAGAAGTGLELGGARNIRGSSSMSHTPGLSRRLSLTMGGSNASTAAAAAAAVAAATSSSAAAATSEHNTPQDKKLQLRLPGAHHNRRRSVRTSSSWEELDEIINGPMIPVRNRRNSTAFLSGQQANSAAMSMRTELSSRSGSFFFGNNNNSMHNIFANLNVPFSPQTFPFSVAVPVLLRELHLLVIRYFLFAVKNNELGARTEEICSALVSAFRTICGAMLDALRKDGKETPLSKACQISLDAATLSLASDSLWQMVENGMKHFHWTEKLDSIIARSMMQGMMHLRQLVTQAQDMIFELLSSKIDGLLESLVFINFQPTTKPSAPHESIEELIAFLQITFMWLNNLPRSVREAVHFTCCTHVATGIISHILSPQVPKLNVLCLKAFEIDVRRLNEFSDSCGVPDLRHCFNELSDLVQCLLNHELHVFAGDPAERRANYPYANASKLVVLLEKIVPSSPAAIALGLPTMDRSEVRAIVRKLRQQLSHEY